MITTLLHDHGGEVGVSGVSGESGAKGGDLWGELGVVWAGLTGAPDPAVLAALRVTGDPDPAVDSVHALGRVATLAVATATLAVAVLGAERTARPGAEPPPVEVDPAEALQAFASERHLRLAGRAGRMWEPLSGLYRTSDGWLRLHANLPHHARAAARAVGVAEARGPLRAAFAELGAVEAEDLVLAAGGAAAAWRSPEQWAAHPQAAVVARQPLIDVQPVPCPPSVVRTARVGARAAAGSGAPGRPLTGLRVLDLTRIIAGPVAARVLTSWGADVVAVRSPDLPTMPWVDLDTGFGKRLRLLDLRDGDDRAAFAELVRGADVVVQGYRPGALEALGFGPADLAALHPGIGYVSVSAYGGDGAWGGRRGFDSLVQTATGISAVETRAAGADRPAPLPLQALDHATGWLAAAAAIETVRRARRDGRSWRAEVTLAGVGRWLTGLGPRERGRAGDDGPRASDPPPSRIGAMRTPAGTLTYVLPPGRIDGRRPAWDTPPPFPPPPGRT